MLMGWKQNMYLDTCMLNRDLKKRARSFKREDNNVYGIYDDSGEMSDYTTVEDTNDYYGH